MKRRKCLISAGLMVLLSSPVLASWFSPELEPWDMWVVGKQSNPATIDHSSWQEILNLYLVTDTQDGINRFDYGAVTSADRQRLRDYLQRLAAIDPRDYRRTEQRPYWINLYNALTVELILDNYPVRSIKSIGSGFLQSGPWKQEVVAIGGQPLTLDDIEHRILRPIWRDPRIHFAVNCASIGCPNLAAQAFTAANTEDLLEQGARDYINHPRGARLENEVLTLSSIFDWYATDFGASRDEVLQELARYAEPGLSETLRNHAGLIRYDYDWRLNDIN
jgi:hypothetical protein